MAGRRALHWVLKISNRAQSINFFRDTLGMQVLRHEEFERGCEATCNGPYDNKWSKTMIGYGPEDTHFVLELTYNYGVEGYRLGNDLNHIAIESCAAYANLTSPNNTYPYTQVESSKNVVEAKAPDGYKFLIGKCTSCPSCASRITDVSVNVTSLPASLEYWRNVLGMSVYSQTADKAALAFASDQAKLELVQSKQRIEHLTASGRIAFACLWDDQETIRDAVKALPVGRILNDLTELSTPGKAAVRVLILLDPDDYEICFVGDEGFRALSQFDPGADKALNDFIAKDKSNEWFANKGKSKASP